MSWVRLFDVRSLSWWNRLSPIWMRWNSICLLLRLFKQHPAQLWRHIYLTDALTIHMFSLKLMSSWSSGPHSRVKRQSSEARCQGSADQVQNQNVYFPHQNIRTELPNAQTWGSVLNDFTKWILAAYFHRGCRNHLNVTVSNQNLTVRIGWAHMSTKLVNPFWMLFVTWYLL